MSQSPAPFRELKLYILEYHEKQMSFVADDHLLLRQLCESIERCFRLGMRPRYGESDYWHWMSDLLTWKGNPGVQPNIAAYGNAVEKVSKCNSVVTAQGRGRLLLRTLLQSGLLSFPVQFMLEQPNFGAKFYDPSYSPLGNEIFVQIFYSLICEVCRMQFRIELRNAEFLDDTWSLPIFRYFEFVPCFKLGARFDSLDGHAVLTRLDPDGVAAEDNHLEIGDVLILFYGQPVRNLVSKLSNLRRSHKNEPIPVCVAKRRTQSGEIYQPIELLLKRFKKEQLLPINKSIDQSSSAPTLLHDSQSEIASCSQLFYIGQCDAGRDGKMHVINRCITQVLASDQNTCMPVVFDLGELGLTVWSIDPQTLNGKSNTIVGPLFRHTYPQISACGRRTDGSSYLAYVAGRDVCMLEQNYQCIVFKAMDADMAKHWVREIAQGFARTRWTL